MDAGFIKKAALLGGLLILLTLQMAPPSDSQPICTGGIFNDIKGATLGDAFCGYVEEFSRLGITGGCVADDPVTPGNDAKYCPGDMVTRGQMAAFIEASLGVPVDSLPPCAGTVFGDVNAQTVGAALCRFIEDFASRGITGGCGGGNYCPGNLVNRQQMAVFLEGAMGRMAGQLPSLCTGVFSDVGSATEQEQFVCRIIEDFAAQGITGGCSTPPPLYCPGDPVTRAQMAVFLVAAPLGPTPPIFSRPSINSTSSNSLTPPLTSVGGPAFVSGTQFQVFAANDLGMHCGDLDHRVASILPPFNVVHAQVVRKASIPEILTVNQAGVFYAAASNPQDPAMQELPASSVFKTNFWDLNPRGTGNTLAFDAYNPFYPPGILPLFPLLANMGLPVPDTERLYLVDRQLVADQHSMPGLTSPYSANDPQRFLRFNTDLPFFINFPFGYTLRDVRWFAAEGIPIAPFDDQGRRNSYPLMRVQSRAAQGNGLGLPPDTVLASIDTVVPVSAEAKCSRCHTSSQDGGNGQAACLPGMDPGCTVQGTLRSGTRFTVATAAGDTPSNPPEVRQEWAADLNIIRLHDAKVGTNHENNTPVVCQRCHYSPALDLAHLGPVGPGDTTANGREQRIRQTNSRVLHDFHGRMEDLFPNDMPSPTDPRRLNPGTGRPVINTFVLDKLDQTCYQCHPGKKTQCLRGAMYNGGLICHDCHGGMPQVGDDFSVNLSAGTPFPDGADLTRRIPWANEPRCQSCHTGDTLTNLGLTDSDVIRSTDGIRLLRAYRTSDRFTAKSVVAQDRRFAENQTPDGKQILYRLSKGHGGVFCQACHGSTHAEWPVLPDTGTFVANDNIAALQLQGHTGKIIECAACHGLNLPPLSLNGPHGLHPVNDQRWVRGHGDFLEGQSLDTCRRCHGVNGEGTVLSKTPVSRSLAAELRTVNLGAGTLVGCGHCHNNPVTG